MEGLDLLNLPFPNGSRATAGRGILLLGVWVKPGSLCLLPAGAEVRALCAGMLLAGSCGGPSCCPGTSSSQGPRTG